MRRETFHFEIKDLVTQFVAAFDDIIIKRFDKNRAQQSKVQVRYVYAPKQRVIYDLVNKAQNLTVPVVSVSITNITRDENRVFNKLAGFYVSRGVNENDTKQASQFYRTPIPVNIGISMSIITKFQSDMDQIISNFVPYNNPYIILSWRVPDDIIGSKANLKQEIRSEVLWDGSVNLAYPIDIASNDKYRIVGDTTFTIKGWLFPAVENSVGNIYYINSNFYVSSNITTYDELTANSFIYPLSTGLVNETETISVSGSPTITGLNYI